MSNPFDALEARLVNIEALLLSALSQSAADPACDGPMCTEAACAFLDLERPTLYALVQKHKIPHHRRGKKLYFFKGELISWIKEGSRLEKQAECVFIHANKKGGKK